MNAVLNELGVSKELQAYFDISELRFSYGNDDEYFGKGFHFIPTTSNLWMAGSETATELIITSSAMEAVAFLTLNAYRYPVFPALSFIAVGTLPHTCQWDWIGANCHKRKITFAFGNDLPGRLADIAMSAGIRNKPLRLYWSRQQILMTTGDKQFFADPESISLHAFEKAAGIRTGIRTRKPLFHNTFLEQLLNENRK